MHRGQLLVIVGALAQCAPSIDDGHNPRIDQPFDEAAAMIAGEAGSTEIMISSARRLNDPEVIDQTVQVILNDERIFADHYMMEGYIPAVLLDSNDESIEAYFIDLSAATEHRPVLRPAEAHRAGRGFRLRDPNPTKLPSEVPAIPAPFLKSWVSGSGEQ